MDFDDATYGYVGRGRVHRLWTSVLTIPLTLVATRFVLFLVRQFLPREAKIQNEIRHLYGVRDARFVRSI